MLRQRQEFTLRIGCHVTNVVFMVGQCLRRWPNVKTSLGQRLVVIGYIVLDNMLQCSTSTVS